MADSPQLTASDLSPQKSSLTSQELDSDHLKSSLREAEFRLVQSKEHFALTEQHLEDAREELERSHKHIENQAKIIYTQNQELTDLKERLQEAKRQHRFEGEDAQPLSFQTQIRERDDEVNRLKEIVSTKDTSLQSALAKHELVREKMQDFGIELSRKDKEIESLKRELAASKRSTDIATLNRRGEGPLLVQVEHLKADNERLIKLLKSTKEFKDFSEFAGSMSGFVAVPPPALAEDEWIPLDAFTLAHEFFTKNPGETTERKVNLLLSQLNQIWRDREKAQITQIKMKCAREVESLRRQLNMQNPSEIVRAETDVERLKGDLKLAYKHMRENISSAASATRAAARPGSAAPREVSDLKKQLHTLTQENRKLQSLKTPIAPEEEKMDFFDGAVWIGQRIQKEALKLQDAICTRVTELTRGLADSQMTLTQRRQQEKLLVKLRQEAAEAKVREFCSNMEKVVNKTIAQQRLN